MARTQILVDTRNQACVEIERAEESSLCVWPTHARRAPLHRSVTASSDALVVRETFSKSLRFQMIRFVTFDALHTLITPRKPIHVQYAEVFTPYLGTLPPDAIAHSFKLGVHLLSANF